MTKPDLEKLIQTYADQGLMTHAYAAAGDLRNSAPNSEVSLFPDGRDLFDLASLTKALVTTPLIWDALPRDHILNPKFRINDWLGPKSDVFPDYVRNLSVYYLLRHMAGVPPWWNFWVQRLGILPEPANWRERQNLVVETLSRINPDKLRPEGKDQVYSDVGFIVLGAALEAQNERSLSELFSNWQSSVLGATVSDLIFRPSGTHRDRSITSGHCAVRQTALEGLVHDENCAALGSESGHCGLFGTGPALCLFLHRWLGTPQGQNLLDANQRLIIPVQASYKNGRPNESLLGFRQGSDFSSVSFFQGNTAGHMGFTGTAFWIAIRDYKYSILLTNRVVSQRINPRIKLLRNEAFALLNDLC